MKKMAEYSNKHLSCCFLSWPAGEYKKVVWEITNKCNLRCSHCIASADKNCAESDLSGKELLDVAQILSENKVSKVLLTGGEPLLRNEIYDIIRYLNKKNIATKLATNGMLLR